MGRIYDYLKLLIALCLHKDSEVKPWECEHIWVKQEFHGYVCEKCGLEK